jgi:hypothetical protein
MLVQGDPGLLGPDWQVIAPDLEEIVLAYLERPSTGNGAGSETISGARKGELS